VEVNYLKFLEVEDCIVPIPLPTLHSSPTLPFFIGRIKIFEVKKDGDDLRILSFIKEKIG